MKHKTFILLLINIFITGCNFNQDNTDQLIEDIKNNVPKNIEPLPEIKEYLPVEYTATNIKDPFSSFNTLEIHTTKINAPINKLQLERPDHQRPREYLENYNLDNLTMVGTLKKSNFTWGLIVDKSGMLHKVMEGNYVGKNSGKIKHISDEKIEIEEIVPDDQGGWINRVNTLKIKEKNQ